MIFQNIQTLLKSATHLLKSANIDSARLDAELLAAHVLHCSRLDLFTDSARMLTPEQEAYFFHILGRRLCHEPMAYILGEKEFYGRTFAVGPETLIPRPDTECIVEECLNLISQDEAGQVLDVCAGTGCIGLTLALERPNLKVWLSDISHDAVERLKSNVNRHQLASRVKVLEGDLLTPFEGFHNVSLIVANPPYIAPDEMPNLSLTVRGYEPRQALKGEGKDGIGHHVRLLEEALLLLAPGGYLVMEMGQGQASLLGSLERFGYENPRFIIDLAGNYRGIVFRKLYI